MPGFASTPRRALLTVTLAALGSLPLAGAAGADAGGAKTYRITIQNMTPSRGGGASQVLSPALVLAHSNRFDLFEVGQRANQAVADVAEDAVAATGLAAYANDPEVELVTTGPSAPILPGAQASFEITTRGNATKLSLVSMLVNTNDGFTGLDGVQLTGNYQEYWTNAYDAGSEVNDQLEAHIPGPCCGDTGRSGTPENGVITHHAGIQPNTGDLSPAQWGWPAGPVARIVVERVR
jgi:hypothetical protein